MNKYGATAVKRIVLVGLAAVLLLAGCTSTPASQPRTVTVLAAASLTGAFTEIEHEFEARHRDVDVKISFQGSATLAEQVINGVPADVFASANTVNMDKVAGEGLTVGQPRVFATNRLQIIVGANNTKNVRSLADLARTDVSTVVCAPEVPCGAASRKAAAAAGVPLRPVSEENDVKSVVHKVTAGEADAGLVYVSDVRAAGAAARGVDFPESAAAVNEYPIAVLRDAPLRALGEQFVRMVHGEIGRQALARAGFGDRG